MLLEITISSLCDKYATYLAAVDGNEIGKLG